MGLPNFLKNLITDNILNKAKKVEPTEIPPLEQEPSETINQEKADEIITRIKYEYDTVKLDLDTRKFEFEKSWKQFSSRGENKLCIPKTFTQSWVLLAKAINTFITPNNFFDITPRRGRDDRPEANRLSEGMSYELYKIPDFLLAIIKNFMQAIVDKVTVFKSGWDFDENCPLFPFILNKDVWWDKTANLPNQIRWIHQRIMYSRNEIKEMGETGYFKNTKEFLSTVADYQKENKFEQENPYKDMIETRECWTKDECVVIGYSNNEPVEVLRKIDNRLKRLPYAVATFIPDLEGTGGFSIPEIMKHLQIALNVNTRLQIEQIKYEIMGFWLYPEGKEFSEKAIEILRARKPGQFAPKPPDMTLENMQGNRNSNPMFMQGRELDLEIQDATSGYNIVKGQGTSRKETLGALEMAKDSANERQMAWLLVMSTALDYIGKVILQHIFWYENKIDVEKYDREKGDTTVEEIDFSKFRNDDVFKLFSLEVTSDLNPTKLLDTVSFFKVIELLQGANFANCDIDWDELGKEAVELTKPGYGDKVFKGETQGLINALKKLPPEQMKTIVRLGTQMMKVMEQNQGGAGGGGDMKAMIQQAMGGQGGQ